MRQLTSMQKEMIFDARFCSEVLVANITNKFLVRIFTMFRSMLHGAMCVHCTLIHKYLLANFTFVSNIHMIIRVFSQFACIPVISCTMWTSETATNRQNLIFIPNKKILLNSIKPKFQMAIVLHGNVPVHCTFTLMFRIAVEAG